MESAGIGRSVNKYGYSRGWKGNLLRTDTGFAVLAVGLDGGSRGVKLGNLRPDLIVLDDVDSLADTADGVQKKIDTLRQTILPSMAPWGAVVFVQNKIHAQSVMARVLSGELDVLVNRISSPIVPAVRGLKTREEPLPDGRLRNVIIEGEPTWAGKDLEICQSEIDDFGLESFLRECQHETGAGGLLFPKFSEAFHVCEPFAVPKHWQVWASHDYGTGAPCAFYVFTVDEAGDIYVLAEFYKSGLESSEQCEAALVTLERLGLASPADPENRAGVWRTRAQLVAFDYANTFPPEKAEERIGEYPVEVWWRRGLNCIRAVKDRKAGWARLNEWFLAARLVEGERVARFRIVRGAAPRLVKALTQAPRWKKDLDELDDGFSDDHGLDALRYGLMVRESPSGPDPETKEADNRPLWMKRKDAQAKRKL